jgi:nitrogen fixation protein FixH
MKIKFNWGTGIFIVLAIFFIAIIAFFLYITNLDIHLVEDNYYEKELVYQQRIDKLKNTQALNGKIEILKSPGIITIQFPFIGASDSVNGTAWFYRPSDPGKDFTLLLNLNDSLQQSFDVSKIDRGKWMIKLDWKMGEKEYYFEETVFIEH